MHRMPSVVDFFPAKEPLMMWLFCGKCSIKIRHRVHHCHPVLYHMCVCAHMCVFVLYHCAVYF